MDSRGRIVLCVGDCFPTARDAEMANAALDLEGVHVLAVASQESAARLLCDVSPAVVVIDLGLAQGSPLAVADFCSYRRPDARVILVGCGGLMADGAIFGHVVNAAALVPRPVRAADMAALIAFHAERVHSSDAPIPLPPCRLAEVSGPRLPSSRNTFSRWMPSPSRLPSPVEAANRPI